MNGPGDGLPQAEVTIKRFDENPIIRPEMLPAGDGDNINGPTLIRADRWIENPLAKYYLYFAHHGGSYIRMAYADKLTGPWQIYEGGVLDMSSLDMDLYHIASPDVVYDNKSSQLRMYFHLCHKNPPSQPTHMAVSTDGLNFTHQSGPQGASYFRVFAWENRWYAIAFAGKLYGSDDGVAFTEMHNLFMDIPDMHGHHRGARHVALDIIDSTLWIYYSNRGDAPERILRAKCKLSDPPESWRAVEPMQLMRPETPYEGADLPITESMRGPAQRSHALRDPYIYNEDGKKYLLYSVAGECGIAIAELENTAQ